VKFKDMLSREMITIEEGELLEGIRNVVLNEECVKEAVIVTSEIGHVTGVVDSLGHVTCVDNSLGHITGVVDSL
jgi:hypothetical protein